MYFRTLSKAVNHFTALGYNFPFDFSKQLHGEKKWAIVETHRFEGFSDPSDNSILYLLENDNGIDKGMVIDCYGAGRDERINKFLQDVSRNFPDWILRAEPQSAYGVYEENMLQILYR